MRFSQAQCKALLRTFGSWDWSPGKLSGGEECRFLACIFEYGQDDSYKWTGMVYNVESRPLKEVRLLLSLIKATCEEPDHSHGCVTQYREKPHASTIAALKRRTDEIIVHSKLPALEKLARV